MVAEVTGKHLLMHVGDMTGPKPFNIAQVKPAPTPAPPSVSISIATHESPATIATVFHTEIILPTDHRCKRLDTANCQEIMGLIDKGTFRIILREDAEQNPNIILSRYVLSIKHRDGTEKRKGRCVLGGHQDRMRNSLAQNSTTLRHFSVRLVLALATLLGLDICSCDVR